MLELIQRSKKSMTKYKETMLAAVAAKYDAYTLTDEFGYIALVQRMYDGEGVEVVQHYPDPCDFHSLDRILQNPGKHLI